MTRNTNKIVAHFHEADAQKKIFDHLLQLIIEQQKTFKHPLIVICIGSDRYTGDSLGPLVGSHLKESSECIVYGSLEGPVHAGNLVETIEKIRYQYYNPLVIAVDACLGKINEIGNIEIWEGSLQAGIAVGNKLPSVGNISIIGVVNGGGMVGYHELQTAPLSNVMKLSKIIGNVLSKVIAAVNSNGQQKFHNY